MATLTAIPFYLILTFTDTGAEQKYLFDSKANCKAAIAPMAELYSALKQPVDIKCVIKLQTIESYEREELKHKTKIKYSYKVKTSYKF